MQAIETLEDVIEQSRSIFDEIESLAAVATDEQRNNDIVFDHTYTQPLRESHPATRLEYLTSHLGALRATLSVLLQTLYTAQSIIWSKLVYCFYSSFIISQ
jgi:hypothetical protein